MTAEDNARQALAMRFCHVAPTSTKAKYGQLRLSLAAHLTCHPLLPRELHYPNSSQCQTPAFYDKNYFRIVVSKQMRHTCFVYIGS